MGRLNQNKKKRRRKKILLTFLVIALVLIAAVGGYAATLYKKGENLVNGAQHGIERDPAYHSGDKLNKDSFSVLFMGVDQRKKGTPTRSDALVLATFNSKKDTIKLVSIPRDSRVKIVDPKREVDKGMDKITHAHAFGDVQGRGPGFTVATVEHLFDIPIDYYVQVDFKAFINIINALGGIDVDVPVKLVTQDSEDHKGAIVLQPGEQHLNGEEALAFVRNRKSPGSGGDFGRGERQMQVIQKIIDKGTSISSITKYGDVIDSLKGHLKTNMSFDTMKSMLQYANDINSVKRYQLKGTNERINGIYYYNLDEEYLQKLRQILKDHLGITGSSAKVGEATATKKTPSGSTLNSLAK